MSAEFEMEFKISFEVLYYCFAALTACYPIRHTTELCKMAELTMQAQALHCSACITWSCLFYPSSLFPFNDFL